MRVRDTVVHFLYRRAWDVRARNLPAAQAVRSVLADRDRRLGADVLDVGCGQFGLASFLGNGISTVGLDTELTTSPVAFPYVRGSADALPFRDRSCPVVASVDVLEHVAVSHRRLVISELVRVAQVAVVIACPHGETAMRLDEEFRRACVTRRRDPPPWLDDHLRHRHPHRSEILSALCSAAAATGRRVDTALGFAEPSWACRLVRAAAARSDVLYLAANLLLGAAYAAVPTPNAEQSYRIVIVARLSGGEARPPVRSH